MSNLKDHISIKQLTADEFWPLFDQHVKSVFENDHSYNLSEEVRSADSSAFLYQFSTIKSNGLQVWTVKTRSKNKRNF